MDDFRSHLGKYLDLAINFDESQSHNLFVEGQNIADIYFSTADSKTRSSFDVELTAALKANLDLKHLWIPLGNAFQKSALEMVQKRRAQIRRIRWTATVGSGVVGFLVSAGLIQLKVMLPSGTAVEKLSTATAIGLLSGSLGYFVIGPAWAHYSLPTDLLIQSAEDFLDRYPHGQEFLEGAAGIGLDMELSVQSSFD